MRIGQKEKPKFLDDAITNAVVTGIMSDFRRKLYNHITMFITDRFNEAIEKTTDEKKIAELKELLHSIIREQ